MREAGGDLHDGPVSAGERDEQRRRVRQRRAAVRRDAELPVVVLAKRIELTGARQREAVCVAGGDLADRAARAGEARRDRRRVRRFFAGVHAGAELSVEVRAERIERAAARQREALLATRRDLHDSPSAGGDAHLRRCRVGVRAAAVQRPPELPVQVAAERVELAVGGDREARACAGGGLHDRATGARHIYGQRCRIGRFAAVMQRAPELSKFVEAKGVELTRRTRERLCARGDRPDEHQRERDDRPCPSHWRDPSAEPRACCSRATRRACRRRAR